MRYSAFDLLRDFRRVARIPRSLRARDKRTAPRFAGSGLFAYYWDGGIARAHEVVNISETGAYFNAPVCYVGTIIELTLQTGPNGANGSGTGQTVFRVPAKVARIDPGGLGVQFVFAHINQRKEIRSFLNAAGTNRS